MQIEAEILRITSLRFSEAFARIEHAIEQLDDVQVRHRPSATSNSVGVIVQHLIGNLNQWICSAIGGETFQRNRPKEFEDTNHATRDTILLELSVLARKVDGVINHISLDSLLSSRRIQGFDETVLSAVIAAMAHLELHSGQITYLAKLILDKKYAAYWQPGNKEQGGE